MIAPPSPGIPRPLGQDPKKDSKVTNGTTNSGYKGREMDERKRKLEENRLRELALQKHLLELKELDLRTWEDHNNQLIRQLNTLKNHKLITVNKIFGSPIKNPASSLNLKILERQKADAVARLEQEIAVIERENAKLEHETAGKKKLLEDKGKLAEKHGSDASSAADDREKADKAYLQQIAQLEEFIKNKTAELKKIENEDVRIKQEIETLRKEATASEKAGSMGKVRLDEKLSEKKGTLEKLRSELVELQRAFEARKSELEAKIKTFEQELESPKSSSGEKTGLKGAENILEKQQDERALLKQIMELREEIKIKTVELQQVEAREKDLQKEIPKLREQTHELDGVKSGIQIDIDKLEKENADKIEKNKIAVEKLKKSILELNQSFEIKKRETEEAGNALQEKEVQAKKQTEEQAEKQAQLIQAKEKEKELYANKIKGAEEEKVMILARIQKLQNAA